MTRLSASTFVLVAFVALPALGQNSASGKEHFDRAMILFNLQDWPSAIRELKQAYQADARPEYLFTLGQAQRLSGDCAAAILSYKAFIRTASGNQAAAAEGLIHSCEGEVAKARKAEEDQRAEQQRADEQRRAEEQRKADEARRATEPAASREHPAASATAPAPPEVRRWYGDPLGGVLFFPGAAGVAAGAVFLVLGNDDVGHANTAAVQGDHDKLVRSGQLKQTVGVVALAAGGALVAGGVIRYLLVGLHSEAPTVALVPTAGGAAAVVSGTF